jgi:cell division septum initiation protein DivIVA
LTKVKSATKIKNGPTVSIKEMLSNLNDIKQEQFDKLFVRDDGFSHMLLSDVDKFIDQVTREFPSVVQV